MKTLMAAIAAIAVQPFVFVLRFVPDILISPGPLDGLGSLFIAVIVVAAAFVLLLGMPAFLVLRKYRRESWITLGTTGFMLGALPPAVFWPRHLEGLSSGGTWHGRFVDRYVNGEPTIYAWLSYGEGVLWFGLHGLAGALVFYAVWLWLGHSNETA